MKSNRIIIIIIIIIKMIIFVIHMYLWGIGTVFLSRYPRICNLTNVELGGGNWVLAEANCSTSSSRWSYFQFTCICEILTLYFSANAFVFQNGISLDSDVKFDFWKRQNAENPHPDDHVSNSHVFVRNPHQSKKKVDKKKSQIFVNFRVWKSTFQYFLRFFKNYWDFQTLLQHVRKWVGPI